MRVYYSLYGQMLDKQRLYKGFKKVWKAKGAAGIDGQSLSDYASNLVVNLDQLLAELQDKSYSVALLQLTRMATALQQYTLGTNSFCR